MIICPNCKEQIPDDSSFCDQCGQPLSFCERCGRVGKGRRCTYCGGLMISAEKRNENMAYTVTNSTTMNSSNPAPVSVSSGKGPSVQMPLPPMPDGIPCLSLYNGNLNIRIVGYNGAIIGRRQGPYKDFFAKNMYVSGVHAQLNYSASSGWSIVDKHSSNGTKLNQRKLQPDVPVALHNGDMLSIANISLQVIVQ